MKFLLCSYSGAIFGIMVETAKGRGARSNASGRYETDRREAFDDGWEDGWSAGDSEAPPLRTQLMAALDAFAAP